MPKSYTVGYGRPPKQSRFRAGKSGNPRGRPKGTKNLRHDLEEELSERVLVTVQGKKRTISRQRALLKALIGKALHGDVRGISTMLNLMLRLLPPKDEDVVEVDLSATDRAILRSFQDRIQEDKPRHRKKESRP